MSEQRKNIKPEEWGFIGDETVSMSAKDFSVINEVINEMLADQTKVLFPEKYEYVDVNSGNPVAKLTEKNKSTSKRIVNFKGTMETKPTVYRTIKGMKLLELKLALGEVFMQCIEGGVAKHFPTLQKEAEMAAKGTPFDEEAFNPDQVKDMGETTEGTEV